MDRMINVQMAIMSHLSDSQYLMRSLQVEKAERHVDFAKLLMMEYSGNLNVYVSRDTLDELWMSLDHTDEK